MSVEAIIPTPCTKCGCTNGIITESAVACTGCGAKRLNVSAMTRTVLAAITDHFGEIKEPIAFRCPGVIEKIKQQDEYLKRRRTPTGKTWFDIVTDSLDENYLATPDTGPESDDG